ncbi:MAG: DNA/RNA non-specific endonuclease [Bacteroidota bacterium]
MRRILIIFVGFLMIFCFECAQQKSKRPVISGLEIPKIKPTDVVISHTGYSFLFSDIHKQSVWVAYELTAAETHKIYKRSNKFIPDPAVKSGTATDLDYKKSGYDRGHLAPAADMEWSQQSMQESFYYSNMSPQQPSFNRGIWNELEQQVREWAIEDGSIYIVTGPVLNQGLPTIGPDRVSVPKYFYKVILDYTEPEIKGIGFIIPNQASTLPVENFAVTIDSVEKFTGLDFFTKIPDAQESQIEKTLCLKCWTWR